MTYLHRQAEKRKDPRRIMPEARVAVVTLTNYFHGSAEREAAGKVAQYARSRDYHDVLGERLERLAAAIRELCPGAHTRCYVDAGPVPERELAQRAGLGWIGKNTMLIDPAIGSFTFIGTVLTDADLPPDPPFEADRCGSCRACLDACPTEAFPAPHTLDARRCISYLTIEHRRRFTDEQQAMVSASGCSVATCARTCVPGTCASRARRRTRSSLPCRSSIRGVDAFDTIDATAFDRRYGATPFQPPGLSGMRRNAAAVRANGVRARLTARPHRGDPAPAHRGIGPHRSASPPAGPAHAAIA